VYNLDSSPSNCWVTDRILNPLCTYVHGLCLNTKFIISRQVKEYYILLSLNRVSYQSHKSLCLLRNVTSGKQCFIVLLRNTNTDVFVDYYFCSCVVLSCNISWMARFVRKKYLMQSVCLDVFLQLLSVSFFSPRILQRNVINLHRSSCKVFFIFVLFFSKSECSRQGLVNAPIVLWGPICSKPTNWRSEADTYMTKLIVAFWNFLNESKNCSYRKCVFCL
jgi:hypothetical protein